MVRVRNGPAGMTGFLFFCAATGRPEAKAKTSNRVTVRTKIALFAGSTYWIVREIERVCLATDEFNVALISRNRDRSPAVTDIADDPAAFTHQFHAVVPKSAQRDFFGGARFSQIKTPIARKRTTDNSFPRPDSTTATPTKISLHKNIP